MYVISPGCDMPNSETPLTQAQIDAQARRVNRTGELFFKGNQIMGSLIAAMTPPLPTGECSDFTSSDSMICGGRFPLSAAEVQILNAAGLPAPPASAMAPTVTGTSASYAAAAARAIASPAAGNQAAIEYPQPRIQRIAQLLVPPACTNMPGVSIDKAQPGTSGTAVLWIAGALAAAALLLSGGDR